MPRFKHFASKCVNWTKQYYDFNPGLNYPYLKRRYICCPEKRQVHVMNNVLSQHAWLDKSAKQTSPPVFIVQTQHGATLPGCSRWDELQMWCHSHPESPLCWTKPRNTEILPGSRSALWGVNRGREQWEKSQQAALISMATTGVSWTKEEPLGDCFSQHLNNLFTKAEKMLPFEHLSTTDGLCITKSWTSC